MKTVYHKEKIVKTEYDEKSKVILVTWLALSGHNFLKECVTMHIDLVANEGAKALIIDVSQATGVPTQEEQSWFGTYVFPEYEKFGLQLIVTILPKSAITEMSARKWNQTASNFKFKTFDTASLESAMDLVKSEIQY